MTTSTLQSTSLKPLPPPGDIDYFPFTKGLKLTASWTNTKHLRTPAVETFTVDAVVNTRLFHGAERLRPDHGHVTYG